MSNPKDTELSAPKCKNSIQKNAAEETQSVGSEETNYKMKVRQD